MNRMPYIAKLRGTSSDVCVQSTALPAGGRVTS